MMVWGSRLILLLSTEIYHLCANSLKIILDIIVIIIALTSCLFVDFKTLLTKNIFKLYDK